MTFPYSAYLRSLGMGPALIRRLSRVFDFYSSILPESVETMFVCDYFNDDGTRSYDSAWLFTDSYAVEARDWETEDNWDALRITRLTYWRLQKENYDFHRRATDRSRFNLEFTTLTNSGNLRAAGNNCKRLKDIFLKYIMRDMGET